jgi:Na+/melibiose symporter-like transporter
MTDTKSGIRALWQLVAGNRNYRLLLSAGVVSLTGDAIMAVGLTYYVYAVTGSTLASGMTLLAALLPQITLGSIAGVFVDRWDRRRTMIATNLLLAAGLMPLLFVHGAHQIWIVYLVALWEGAVEQLFAPAEAALVPNLVAEPDLVAANALNNQNRDISRLVGAALGGVIAAVGGIAMLTLVDAATFVIAAALLAAMRHVDAAAPADAIDVHPLRALVREWSEGLGLTVASRTLRTLLICFAITCVGEGVLGTLIAPWVRDILHGSGETYGLIVSVQAIGGIAGGLAAGVIGRRISPQVLLGWCSVAFGAIDLVLFLYPVVHVAVWPAIVFMIAVGTPGALMNAGRMALLQTSTQDASRGRVMGAMYATMGVGLLIGVGVAASLPSLIGIMPVISIQGSGYVLAGILVLTVLRRPGHAAPAETTPVPEESFATV